MLTHLGLAELTAKHFGAIDMMHKNIQKLINDYQAILDQDPLDQMEDTQSILTRFTQQLATELGEIVVASPFMEGTRMYFDEKIARYEIKNAVGISK
jgi:predicted DNA-binding protein (UPF0278 family)